MSALPPSPDFSEITRLILLFFHRGLNCLVANKKLLQAKLHEFYAADSGKEDEA